MTNCSSHAPGVPSYLIVANPRLQPVVLVDHAQTVQVPATDVGRRCRFA